MSVKEPIEGKRVKENTSSPVIEEKLGEDLEGRVFQLSSIKTCVGMEKQALIALTSKRPDTLPTLYCCEIYLKFEDRYIADFPLHNIREKIQMLKSSVEVRPLISGWFDLQSMAESPKVHSFLSTLADKKCLKHVFLLKEKSHEIWICSYASLEADIADYIDYRPSSKYSQIDFKDLYVFFITNNDTIRHPLLEQSKNKWDIVEHYAMANEQEPSTVDLTILSHHLFTHQEKLEALFREELDLAFEYLI